MRGTYRLKQFYGKLRAGWLGRQFQAMKGAQGILP
jgi:hypothetical protein